MVIYSPGDTTTYPNEPPKDGFRYHFLGGGGEVGCVGLVLEDQTGTRMLIDYGIAPTKPPLYPAESPFVEHAIITHSHIDHSGMAPWLVGNHDTTLHATPTTASLCELMWKDSLKISNIERYPLPWDKRDMDDAETGWEEHEFGEEFDVGDWKVTLHSAGHIPGAAMVEIQTPSRHILVTGDFDTRDSFLTNGALPIEVDTLFIEGTYGSRNHPLREIEVQRLVDRVTEVVERGGTALIPSFAVGRGQEVLMALAESEMNLDIHYDGMGKQATRIFLETPQFLKDPVGLNHAFGRTKRVSSKSDRKRALEADVIVATSGMLDGGPMIWYLNRLRHGKKNAILMVGYQVEGSGGRRLLDTEMIDIYGNLTEVTLECDQFDLSGHSGQRELVEFAKATKAQDIVIYHADPIEREQLKIALGQEEDVMERLLEKTETDVGQEALPEVFLEDTETKSSHVEVEKTPVRIHSPINDESYLLLD